jgi:hypothetical protein
MHLMAFLGLALFLVAAMAALFAPVIMGVLVTLAVVWWFMRRFRAVACL